MSEIPVEALTPEIIFGETLLAWGKEHAERRMIDVWREKRDYLLWAANLTPRKCASPPSPAKVELIRVAQMLLSGEAAEAATKYREVLEWQRIAELGEGLETLPRPSRDECLDIIARCTLLGGHHDLDGIFSLAIAMAKGGALEGGKMRGAFFRLRLFRYGFRNLGEYTYALAPQESDTIVIIDYAAHPRAELTLDHHVTSLSYWELGAPLPRGIFEPSMPSCPRLLATFCGLDVDESILSGCDMIDGALYANVEQASDLTNPFVALELALSLDVSDVVAKKVALTLAEHGLDPNSVLQQPVWKARLELLKLELEEQRSYWSKGQRVQAPNELVAIADSRLAPHSASRFRYLPFELEPVARRPYLITIRPGGSKMNLSIGRNPFYHRPEHFTAHPLNCGALARTLGKGGGRMEIGSVMIEAAQLATTIPLIVDAIDRSVGESR